MLDGLNEGVIVVELKGSILHVNKAAVSMFDLDTHNEPLKMVEQISPYFNEWQALLAAPFETTCTLPNGRLLQLQSKTGQFGTKDVVQILVTPINLILGTGEENAFADQLSDLTRISSEPNFNKKLRLIVNGLQKLGWARVGLSLRDEAFNPTEIITAGFTEKERKHVLQNILPTTTWQSLFSEPTLQQYQRGSCYFVPGESDWIQHHLGSILIDQTASGKDKEAWHPKDLLCAVLHDRQHRKIGLIGLDQPKNGRRPGPRMMQTIELYAQFAASIIENTLLVDETIRRSREFEILFEASHALSTTLDKDAVLTILGEHMMQAIEADSYTVFRWHERENQFIVLQDYNQSNPLERFSQGTAVTSNNPEQLQHILKSQNPAIITSQAHEQLPLPTSSDKAETEYANSALMPLVLSEETYGFIHIVKHGQEKQIGNRDLQLLAALSNQASSALETALIFEDTYEREQFYNALGNVNMAINSTLDSQAVLDLICNEGVRIFDVDGAYIWQLSQAHFVGSAAKGEGVAEFLDSRVSLTQTTTFVSQLAEQGQVMYFNNLPTVTDVTVKLPGANQIKSILGVPLEEDGKLIGLLILVDKQNPIRFTNKDISWASLFGVQVAIALQNANLFAELRGFNEQLDSRVAERTRALNEESNRVKILLRVTTELSASLDQDRVFTRALSLVNEVVNAVQGVILLINHESDELLFRAALGEGSKSISPKGLPSGLHRNEGLAGWMIDNRSAVIVNDTNTDPRWVDLQASQGHRSVLGVPLISNEEVIGVMMLFHSEQNAFTMQQLDLVEAAAIQVANAINNASLYQLIFDQADQLGTMLRSEIIQKANLKAILESIADGVIVADSKSKIDLVNVPASAILDIPREQLIGRSINELLGLYGHIEKSWINTIDHWADNADRIEQGIFLADRLEIEDKVLSVHLSPVLSDRQFYGTVSIFRDITKEVELDKLKSEFVSTVSHELRTPMTSIKGYADLMLMGAAGELSEPQSKYLKVIKNNADRLHMLVNDLLNISRIETGKTTLDLRPLDVPQIIEQIVDGHLNGRIQHQGKKLKVRTEMSPSLPLVNADHARVTQIVTNLLDNAFNYTAENGEICISAEANGNYVFIAVEDTGIGISEDNLAKIFDRFYRAEDENVQKIPGTGLGLAIVQSLIEMHGGLLTVTSELGRGSKFMFNLPVVVEDGDPAAITATPTINK
ncbi:MAG: GAF domain-containing protein [Chloroflexi bacterium]|nr:GAF domain-containing protein [Chloroflexota bacterium]